MRGATPAGLGGRWEATAYVLLIRKDLIRMLGVTRKLQMLGITALTVGVLAACGAVAMPASTQPVAAYLAAA